MICTTIMRAITAVFWDKKKGGTPPKWSPFDFFPSPLDDGKKKQSVDDMRQRLQHIAQSFSGDKK